MLTTRLRVWLQDPRIPPVWTGVRLVGWPQYISAGCIEVTVEGNGSDLRQLIAKRQDIFSAYLQMEPEDGVLFSVAPPLPATETLPRPNQQQSDSKAHENWKGV